jgi:hypothetical protein
MLQNIAMILGLPIDGIPVCGPVSPDGWRDNVRAAIGIRVLTLPHTRKTRNHRASTLDGSQLTLTHAQRTLRTESFRGTLCVVFGIWLISFVFEFNSNLFVIRYARAWLCHMVPRFLFSDGSGNTISWMVLPILHLEWDMISMYSGGPLHSLGCTVRYEMAAIGPVTLPTSTVVHTSNKFGCENVSWLVDRAGVYLRYALTFFIFIIHNLY